MSRINLFPLCLLLLAACSSDGSSGTDVQGVARYRDASTDASGAPRQPAAPPEQSASISVTVRGSGTLSGVDPTCLDQATGQFHALYAGDAMFDGNGGYVSSVGSAGALLQTPGGCTIPDLTVGVITDVVVRAELAATTQNCDTYCSASARAEAQAACQGSPDVVTCWAQAEGQAKGQCMTTCTSQTSHIVAEATIGGSTLGQLDGEALRSAALGQIDVDLTFDTLE